MDIVGMMKYIGFNESEINDVSSVYGVIGKLSEFEDIKARIKKHDLFAEIVDDMKKLSEKCGIHLYRIALCIYLDAFIFLRDELLSDSIPDSVIRDTLEDLLYKTHECETVYGTVGVFAITWYRLFFEKKLFKLGRLEYQFDDFPFEEPYSKNGVTVKYGDKLLSVHIPSCGPMKIEDVRKSFELAKEFFPQYLYDGKLVLRCHSWMLFPDYENVFAAGSNIKEFRKLFDVIKAYPQESFENAWRIFGTDCGDVSKYPSDTTLRRSFIKYIKDGGKHGDAIGFLVI